MKIRHICAKFNLPVLRRPYFQKINGNILQIDPKNINIQFLNFVVSNLKFTNQNHEKQSRYSWKMNKLNVELHIQ